VKEKRVKEKKVRSNMNFKSYITEMMAVNEPSKTDFPVILDKIKSQLNVTGRPEWYRYIANKTEGHSKYHYFFIFKKGEEFIGGNANGRIGYPPMAVHKMAQSKVYSNVLDNVSKKYKTKVANKEYADITNEIK
jgi:hypothetical protein